MAAKRNPTPRDFALTSALIFGAIVFIVLLIFDFLQFKGISRWVYTVIAVLVSTILSYLVLFRLLDRFIYRKIKLIYKNIHDLKLGKHDLESYKLDLSNDIVEEVNDEVQRWAVKKNREIARLKDQENFRKDFLGNVFHEIKTPVFSVQGYLHTLQDGAIDDPNVRYSYLEKAVRNIDRLDHIIQDLELITLKESNKLVLDKTQFDVNSLIKDVFDALELQADAKDIEFGIKESCDRPFKVEADRDKIRQVLVNLINNAIKYGKEGGLIMVGIYDMGANILLEITDNGIGIEQEKLQRLFERFYRVDESHYRGGSDKIGGSGLGLSIVKHIIDAHEQTINVRSTVDVGSTFGFTLKKVRR